MTRASFSQHFDLLGDQPDAVAKMRELVLQLAIRGQLGAHLLDSALHHLLAA